MPDMSRIEIGFNILRRYGSREEVNVDAGHTIYAGPENLAETEYTDDDRVRLENAYWHFNDTIDRWGYSL